MFNMDDTSSDDDSDGETDDNDNALTTMINTSQNKVTTMMEENEDDSMVTLSDDARSCTPVKRAEVMTPPDNGSSHLSPVIQKKPLRRRVEFRTPNDDVPEVGSQTSEPAERRTKRGRLGSPKKAVSSIASESQLVVNEPADIELDIVPSEMVSCQISWT